MRRTRWTGREMRALLDAQEASGLSLKTFDEVPVWRDAPPGSGSCPMPGPTSPPIVEE